MVMNQLTDSPERAARIVIIGAGMPATCARTGTGATGEAG